MLGGYLGARLTGRLGRESLQRLLGGALAVMGLVMVGQGFGRLTRARDLQPPPATPQQERLLEEQHDEWPDWPEPPDWVD
jgi:hypothetical protein